MSDTASSLEEGTLLSSSDDEKTVIIVIDASYCSPSKRANEDYWKQVRQFVEDFEPHHYEHLMIGIIGRGYIRMSKESALQKLANPIDLSPMKAETLLLCLKTIPTKHIRLCFLTTGYFTSSSIEVLNTIDLRALNVKSTSVFILGRDIPRNFAFLRIFILYDPFVVYMGRRTWIMDEMELKNLLATPRFRPRSNMNGTRLPPVSVWSQLPVKTFQAHFRYVRFNILFEILSSNDNRSLEILRARVKSMRKMLIEEIQATYKTIESRFKVLRALLLGYRTSSPAEALQYLTHEILPLFCSIPDISIVVKLTSDLEHLVKSKGDSVKPPTSGYKEGQNKSTIKASVKHLCDVPDFLSIGFAAARIQKSKFPSDYPGPSVRDFETAKMQKAHIPIGVCSGPNNGILNVPVDIAIWMYITCSELEYLVFPIIDIEFLGAIAIIAENCCCFKFGIDDPRMISRICSLYRTLFAMKTEQGCSSTDIALATKQESFLFPSFNLILLDGAIEPGTIGPTDVEPSVTLYLGKLLDSSHHLSISHETQKFFFRVFANYKEISSYKFDAVTNYRYSVDLTDVHARVPICPATMRPLSRNPKTGVDWRSEASHRFKCPYTEILPCDHYFQCFVLHFKKYPSDEKLVLYINEKEKRKHPHRAIHTLPRDILRFVADVIAGYRNATDGNDSLRFWGLDDPISPSKFCEIVNQSREYHKRTEIENAFFLTECGKQWVEKYYPEPDRLGVGACVSPKSEADQSEEDFSSPKTVPGQEDEQTPSPPHEVAVV